MKKLLVFAVIAAMSAGAYASLCDDDPVVQGCSVYNVKISLKTLGPKTIKCKNECTDDSCVAYYENTSRKIDGILWNCDHDCAELKDGMNFVAWEKKTRTVATDPLAWTFDQKPVTNLVTTPPVTNYIGGTVTSTTWFAACTSTNIIPSVTTTNVTMTDIAGTGKWTAGEAEFAILDRYSKKATKVQGGIEFNLLLNGSDAVVTAVGFGTYDSKNDIVKSINGYCVSVLNPIDSVPCKCDEAEPAVFPICDEFTSWCEDEGEAPEGLVAYGTWSVKYNKSLSKGTKRLTQIVPSYAQDR